MKRFVSILHISDLHRCKGCEITNASLLSSLIDDKARYTSEDPKIKEPDLIIVSGDVIRGSTKSTGSDREIKKQYDEALKFLNDLASAFLNGDKSRIVVIPGNHDIDWKFSKESMNKIDSKDVLDPSNILKPEILSESINQNSNIRWSWKDLSFYEIIDVDKYKKRIQAFSDFYLMFYDGKRHYSHQPEEQFDIFDYPNYNITVVAFNSCYNNDHLRLVGDIHPDCIANAQLELLEYRKKGRLILATWHHNTKGLPYDSNYMDYGRLKNFINLEIALGFHGHQHKTELIHEFNNVIEQKKIIVFSAGTLCGGPMELPMGSNRQYNVVEIDWDDEIEFIKVNLHLRQKTETSPLNNPIWTKGNIDSSLVSHCSVEIEKPKIPNIEKVLVEIEQMMKNKDYKNAMEQLLNIDANQDFVRLFLLECVIETQSHEIAISFFSNPKTDAEFVVVLNAVVTLNDKSKMKEFLNKAKEFNSADPSVKELIKKIEAILNE